MRRLRRSAFGLSDDNSQTSMGRFHLSREEFATTPPREPIKPCLERATLNATAHDLLQLAASSEYLQLANQFLR
jgi:hypothetical protein